MNKTVLITGANAGIGKETARQLALKSETELIYLACRNRSKAEAAKKELEGLTAKSIFRIVDFDVTQPQGVKQLVAGLNAIDAVIMNAGGTGGKTPSRLTSQGMTQLAASNLLGHVALLDELISQKKLRNVALFASSEAARGISKMGMHSPKMEDNSVNEFKSVFNGKKFGSNFDPMQVYAWVKYG
ncbi:MAG: SDR family NAD(P)-dependent oxidoreductase, partial [Bacteroidota bacterium]